MISNKKFSVIGGDIRQIYLSKKLKEDKNEVFMYGFDLYKDFQTLDLKLSNSLKEAILNSNYVIFPIPISIDKQKINAPFSSSDIIINDTLISYLKNKVVFGGIISPLYKIVNKSNFNLIDYYLKENFLIPNAILTSQGAIEIALKNGDISLFNSNCLVIGYGRIGKILSKFLDNLGANITISARNPLDIEMAKTQNFKTINISKINNIFNFDIIFNTVPALILNEKNLKFLKNTKLIIDLSSIPGGIDKTYAKKLNLNVIHALAIPGKYFPKSAGEIIANSIYSIIKEEDL